VILAVLVLLATSSGAARAEIIFTPVAVTPVLGGFQYTYDATLVTNSALEASPAGSLNSPGAGGPGNIFTLYNIPGLIPGSETTPNLTPFDWTIAEQTPGIDAPTQASHDGANLNVTFQWTGAVSGNPFPAVGGDLDLGNFSFNSTNAPGGNLFFVAATQKFPADDTIANNTEQHQGPGAAGSLSQVPEPTSVVILGLALVGAGLVGWRRGRRAAQQVTA
jgi:hypothetical protein